MKTYEKWSVWFQVALENPIMFEELIIDGIV